jgi:carbon-monoxide dehydrogenase large subunit
MEDRMTAVNGANEGHGASVRRVEDPPFLRGTRPYTDDLREPGVLYAVFVRSGSAHATINGVETDEALAMPGVVGVYTAADLKLEPFATAGPPVDTPQEMRRQVLATDKVRFIGEPIAVVVADTRAHAVDAAELVYVDTDDLDVVVDMTKALEPGAPQLFEVGNLAASGPTGDDALEGAEVRTGARFVNQRVAAVPMEPSAALAKPDPETGGFILFTPSQGPHAYQAAISKATGIEAEKLRVALARGSRATRSRSSSSRSRVSWAAPSATSRRARRRCSRCSTGARRCRTSRSAAPATARSPGCGSA